MHAAYLDDAYTKEFTTTITHAEGNKLQLAQTYFYPSSGGQPHDTGTIICNGITYIVANVTKEHDIITHEVDKTGITTGQQVQCTINWERRYQLMKMHTAAHLICSVIERETKALTTGNQLNIATSRVDLDLEQLDKQQLDTWQEKINHYIQQDLPVTVYYLPAQEALQDTTLFKLAAGFKHTHLEKIRIVDIQGIDKEADGGTHVKSLKELGNVVFTKTENKGKGR